MSFSANHSEQHWLGRTIASFRVLRLLGKGAMGAVYLAEDSVLKRKIALKLLPKGDDETDEDKFERFLREARSAARIIHPNVVQVFQIGEVEQHRFIAMEYVSGLTLRNYARMQGGRLPHDFAVDRFIEAADALCFAATLGICHRDLKPQNLLLTRHNRLKIADFGLAAQVDGSESIGRSAAGQIEGTPAYMSPEQWGEGSLTPASDIYGIGCAFFRLLAGRAPFKASDLVGYLKAHCRAPIPRLSDIVEDVHPELANIIYQCMAKETQQRPSADELLAMLTELRRTPSSRGSQPAGSHRASSRGLAGQPNRAKSHQAKPPPLPPTHQNPGHAQQPARASWPSASLIEHTGLPKHPSASLIVPATSGDNQEPMVPAHEVEQSQHLADDRPNVTSPVVAAGNTTETSYRDRYGFRAYPFSDIRHVDHYWDGGPYSQVVGELTAALASQDELLIVVGAAGTGKTFACEMLGVTSQHLRAVTIDPSMLFGNSLLQRACREEGVAITGSVSNRICLATLLSHLQQTYNQGLLLIVDGVGGNETAVLEQVQSLAGLINRKNFALIVTASASFLADAGEHAPAFAASTAHLEPVHLRPMTRAEVDAYVRFRLERIGGVHGTVIDSATIGFLHARSGGVARLVNTFCHNALTFGTLRREPPFSFHAMRLALKSRTYLTPQLAAQILSEQT